MNNFVVLLKEKFGDRTLPIWIGETEAVAIAITLEGIKPQRPLTHDLLKLILDSFNARIEKVIVTELKNDTYYAKIYVERDGEIFALDARPSDSVALAMRSKSPIWVNDEIMEKSGEVMQGDSNIEQLRRKLRDTKPEGFGDFELK
jgi:bifunctional DNase/RNase